VSNAGVECGLIGENVLGQIEAEFEDVVDVGSSDDIIGVQDDASHLQMRAKLSEAQRRLFGVARKVAVILTS
jgi:hypothetical protein